MKQWEYMDIQVSNIMTPSGYLDSYVSTERLNHYGKSGWELVMIHENRAIFKREKVD